jgi:hypothetical protein
MTAEIATPRPLLDLADAKPSLIPEVLPSIPTRAQIERLEAEMLKHNQLPIAPMHYFAVGLYAREITIPAGTLLTGKVHKAEHFNIISQGRIVVWTEDGMREIAAPSLIISRPGTKRVGLALETTVWTTIHANPDNVRDPEALEQSLVECAVPVLEIQPEIESCLS